MQTINGFFSGKLSIRQTQATSDGLFYQDFGICRTERNNRIQIIHIPAFAQHVDMDNDFCWLISILYGQQALQNFVFQFAVLLGIDDNNLIFVASAFKVIAFNFSFNRFGMCNIFGNNHHKRLNQAYFFIICIYLKFGFNTFMDFNSVFYFKIFECVLIILIFVKISPSDNGRLFDKTISNSMSQIIFVSYIFEWFSFCSGRFCSSR